MARSREEASSEAGMIWKSFLPIPRAIITRSRFTWCHFNPLSRNNLAKMLGYKLSLMLGFEFPEIKSSYTYVLLELVDTSVG